MATALQIWILHGLRHPPAFRSVSSGTHARRRKLLGAVCHSPLLNHLEPPFQIHRVRVAVQAIKVMLFIDEMHEVVKTKLIVFRR